MKKLTIRIEDELHKKLKHRLLEENKSVNAYVISLIEKDIMEHEKDTIDDFIKVYRNKKDIEE